MMWALEGEVTYPYWCTAYRPLLFFKEDPPADACWFLWVSAGWASVSAPSQEVSERALRRVAVCSVCLGVVEWWAEQSN